MHKHYGHEFYKNRHEKTVSAAGVMLATVENYFPDIKSAVDFGCGVGTWLSVLKNRGTEIILGLDGPWVEKPLLEIDPSEFQESNFETEITLAQKYDLAISLEVAEHLPPANAKTFVKSLTQASNVVLFSAAIPLQGGQGHLNEQWPDYWISLFEDENFVALDLFRASLWEQNDIPPWYRQNCFLYVHQETASSLGLEAYAGKPLPYRMVHPNIFMENLIREPTVKQSLRILGTALKTRVRLLLNRKTH